jgi:predicted CopG family antitoxin
MVTKQIRISNEIYSKILSRKGNLTLEDFVNDLIDRYDASKVTLKYIDRMTFLDYCVSKGCETPEEIPAFDFFFCANGIETPYYAVTPVTKIIRIQENLYDSLTSIRMHPEESYSSVLFRLLTFQNELIVLPSKIAEMILRRTHIVFPELRRNDPAFATEKVIDWALTCPKAPNYHEHDKTTSHIEITTSAKEELKNNFKFSLWELLYNPNLTEAEKLE